MRTGLRRLSPGSLRRVGFAAAGLVAVAGLLAPWIGVDTYWLIQLVMIAVITLIVSGVNLSYGHAGELSLGQVAMFAVGAYLTGYMAIHGLNDLALTLVCAAAAAAVIGVASGVPGLRLGGWSLAMVSFFLVLLIPDFVSIFPGETGGYTGMYGIPGPQLFGWALSTHAFYVAAVVIALVWLVAMRNLVVSRHGDALRVLRESPALARSMGISVYRTKLFAYAMGAVPAGMAGVIFAYLERFVGPDTFSFSFSVAVIAASILGGSESIYGAAFGAALLEVGPLQANLFENYSLLVYGGFLVVGGILLRGGVARVGTTLVRRYLTRVDESQPAVGAAVGPVTGGGGVGGAVTPPAPPRIGDLGSLPGQAVVIEDVAIAFGGVQALGGVTLRAEPGKITAVIGSNGSGKTTLLNLVSGFLRASKGQIHVGDRRIDGLRPHLIARAGVSRTFQTPIVPRSMSCVAVVGSARYVRPSLSVVAAILRLPSSRAVHAADRALALRYLDILGLGALADVEATQLPLGSRRLVEMARALVTEPAVVLLDEPASGLERAEVQALGDVLQAVAGAGGTVVLVEHNFRFVIDIADYVYVLDRGIVIAAGAPAEIERSPAVIASYLGGELALDAAAPGVTTAGGGTTVTAGLQVQGLTSGYGDITAVWDLDLSVSPGRIVALLGRNGAGKTTTLHAIAGLLPSTRGSITVGDVDLTRAPPYRRVSEGIALVQEGKQIFRHLTVEENLYLGAYARRIRRRQLHHHLEAQYEHFPILRERRRDRAGSLSGGQQQMLAIAQALLAEPSILMLDEPSAGLAPAVVIEVFDVVSRLRDQGIGILLVEQLADRALAVADDVIVLDIGRVILRHDASQGRDPAVLEAAYFGRQ